MARPVQNAFASVPVTDYARDGLSALLLLISMFMVWNYGGASRGGAVAASHIDVILITLLSLLSVTLPYLWRSGVFGTGWDYRRTQLARLLTNAPYGIMAVVYLVLEFVHRDGLGPAMAFGLAGAALAAQPRKAELGSRAGDAELDRRWAAALSGFSFVLGVLTLIQIIERLTVVPAGDWSGTLIAVLLAVANAALLIWAGLGTSQGKRERRLVALGVGATGLGLGLLALIPDVTVVSMQWLAIGPGVNIYFWMTFGVMAWAPSVSRMEATPSDEVSAGIAVGRSIALIAFLGSALLLVISVIALTGRAGYSGYGMFYDPVSLVVTIFLAAIGIVGGIITRTSLANPTRQSYLISVGYAGILFIVNLVVVIVAANTAMPANGTLALLLAFALPVALMLALFGKASQRAAFTQLAPSGQTGFVFDNGMRRPPAAAPQFASTPTADVRIDRPVSGYVETAAAAGQPFAETTETVLTVQEPGTDPAVAEANNPKTSAARLQELAASHPPARPLIVNHPNVYPDLLDWLAKLNDPAVNAELAKRSR